jgi:hypothetical protein
MVGKSHEPARKCPDLGAAAAAKAFHPIPFNVKELGRTQLRLPANALAG